MLLRREATRPRLQEPAQQRAPAPYTAGHEESLEYVLNGVGADLQVSCQLRGAEPPTESPSSPSQSAAVAVWLVTAGQHFPHLPARASRTLSATAPAPAAPITIV